MDESEVVGWKLYVNGVSKGGEFTALQAIEHKDKYMKFNPTSSWRIARADFQSDTLLVSSVGEVDKSMWKCACNENFIKELTLRSCNVCGLAMSYKRPLLVEDVLRYKGATL